jgi:hypothetical protein
MAFVSSRGRLAALAAVLGLSLIAGGVAYAAASPAIQTITPRSADQITNLDVLRQQIRNYYGDPLGTGVFAPDSNYAKEASSVAAAGASWLASKYQDAWWWRIESTGPKAIILDVDDTTLATWNYELASNWAYDATKNATFVTGELFPPVPGMVKMVTQAAQEGYAIIWITGRPATQEAVTLANLTGVGLAVGGINAGYPAPTTLNDGEDGLFTKPPLASYPPYLVAACGGDPGGACTTDHYKAATRAHIESLGYDIVASFGDQYSDFSGGYADRTFKMPNPNYFLP